MLYYCTELHALDIQPDVDLVVTLAHLGILKCLKICVRGAARSFLRDAATRSFMFVLLPSVTNRRVNHPLPCPNLSLIWARFEANETPNMLPIKSDLDSESDEISTLRVVYLVY